jgi:hypothetical protein
MQVRVSAAQNGTTPINIAEVPARRSREQVPSRSAFAPTTAPSFWKGHSNLIGTVADRDRNDRYTAIGGVATRARSGPTKFEQLNFRLWRIGNGLRASNMAYSPPAAKHHPRNQKGGVSATARA